MKNLFLFLTLGLAVTSNVYAQDDTVFDKINGTSSSGKIFIHYDESKNVFKYRIDGEEDWYNLDRNIFNIKNHHKNECNIFFEFYNPLQYTINSTVKDLDDPSYKAINDFISQLPSAGTPFTNSGQADGAKAPLIPSLPSGGGLSSFEQSTLLYAWISDFLTYRIAVAEINADPDKIALYNQLVQEIGLIAKTEKYLFGKISITIDDVEKEKELKEWIEDGNKAYYTSNNNYGDFKKAGVFSSAVKEGLDASKEQAVKNLVAVTKLLTLDFDSKIKPLIATGGEDAFKKYSASTSVWLALNTNQRIESSAQATLKFSELNTKLIKFADEFKGVSDTPGKFKNEGYRNDFVGTFDWKNQKMKSFKYELKRISKDGVDEVQSNITGEFTVGKKLIAYPFVTTSALYTRFSYPNYAIQTDNGVNKVAETQSTRVNFRPAIFLNMMLAGWEPIFPFVQVGISTGINDAIFPIGGGFSIGRSFSISGGFVLGYAKGLDKLNVGDVVKDDAALKGDLINRGAYSGYASLNYNIGKK